jgi:mRNA interferase MazF
VSDDIIEAVLGENRDSELERARAVWQKKFGTPRQPMRTDRRPGRCAFKLQSRGSRPRWSVAALVIQSDQFSEHATMTVLLVSSTLVEAPLFRVTVQPDTRNGMQKPSQVMVDKAMTVKRDKLGKAFGSASDEVMLEVGRSLAVFLGIAR